MVCPLFFEKKSLPHYGPPLFDGHFRRLHIKRFADCYLMFYLIPSPIWLILRAAHFKRPARYKNKLHTNGIGYGLFLRIHGKRRK